MAERTNLALGCGQQLSMIRGVRVVATGAFPAFYRSMNKFFGNLVGKIHMTAKAELAAGSGFELEIPFWRGGRAVGNQGQKKQNGKDSSDNFQS